MRQDVRRRLFGGDIRGIDDVVVIFQIFDVHAVQLKVARRLAGPAVGNGAHRLFYRGERLARPPRLQDAFGRHPRVRRHVHRKRRGHKMPRHARIDDDIFRRMLQGAQAVVDLAVDLGVRFHILIELKGGHAHLFGYFALNGARGIDGGMQLFGKDRPHRALAAAQIPRQRNFYALVLLHGLFSSYFAVNAPPRGAAPPARRVPAAAKSRAPSEFDMRKIFARRAAV